MKIGGEAGIIVFTQPVVLNIFFYHAVTTDHTADHTHSEKLFRATHLIHAKLTDFDIFQIFLDQDI